MLDTVHGYYIHGYCFRRSVPVPGAPDRGMAWGTA